MYVGWPLLCCTGAAAQTIKLKLNRDMRTKPEFLILSPDFNLRILSFYCASPQAPPTGLAGTVRGLTFSNQRDLDLRTKVSPDWLSGLDCFEIVESTEPCAIHIHHEHSEERNLMRIHAGRFRIVLIASALLMPAGLSAQSITISPSYAAIGVKQTEQYTATVTGLANSKVTWEVNGVTRGNSTYGTITGTGLYTAPAKIPANGITITAVGSDKKTSATVYIAVEPPGPAISSISPSPIPVGTYQITVKGTNFKKGAIVCGADVNLATTFVNSTTLTAGGYQGAAG